MYYDEKIKLLRQQIEKKKHKEAKLKELHTQYGALSEKAQVLSKNRLNEQADVDRLEGHSLAAFFYGVTGKMDEKLDKERKEAYAASVKYDVAARELSSVEEDIMRYEAELMELRECEQQYEQAVKDKLETIKSLDTPEAKKIRHAEEQIYCLEAQVQEIQEALGAGRAALETTDEILSSLGSAEGWGTWDLLGGGILSDIAKHSHLDNAQCQIENLQVQLRRFKTELTDVTIHADMQINIDGFLNFADYFFDGLFVDWMVLDKIKQSTTQVLNTKDQIAEVMCCLSNMLSNADQHLEIEKAALNDFIVQATV